MPNNIFESFLKIKTKSGKTIDFSGTLEQYVTETCEVFNNAGIQAAHLDGTTPGAERDSTVQAFRDGSITVLCNVDLFGEG